ARERVRRRLDPERLAGLAVDERVAAAQPRRFEVLVREHLDDLALAAARADHVERALDGGALDEEVGDQEDEAAADVAERRVEGARQVRLPGGRRETRQERPQRRQAPARPERPDAVQVGARLGRARRLAVARGRAPASRHRAEVDAIAARERHRRDDSRDRGRHVELPAGLARPHRSARVDQEPDGDLALGDETPREELAEPRIAVPVDAAEVVARGVRGVALDLGAAHVAPTADARVAGPLAGRVARAQADALETREDRGREALVHQAGRARRRRARRPGSAQRCHFLPASTRWSTIERAVTPSVSAAKFTTRRCASAGTAISSTSENATFTRPRRSAMAFAPRMSACAPRGLEPKLTYCLTRASVVTSGIVSRTSAAT